MKKKLLLLSLSLVLCIAASLFFVSCEGKADVDIMDSMPNYESGMDGAGFDSGLDGSAYIDPQKVVKNASVTAETMNYSEATDKLKALIVRTVLSFQARTQRSRQAITAPTICCETQITC